VDFLEGFTRVAVLTDEGGNVHPVGVLWKRNLAALGKTPSRKSTQRVTPGKIEFSSTRDRTRVLTPQKDIKVIGEAGRT